MQLPLNYILDREAIKLNAYRLICHFYANKEIARHTDPDTRDDAIAKLEDNHFFREISRLLLEVAISLRVIDDQMKKLDEKSDIRSSYDAAMNEVNRRYNCMMFDEMNIREVCNKILHAEVVEPHIQESEDGGHEIDNYNWLSFQPDVYFHPVRHEINNYNWLGWSEAVEQSGDRDIPKPGPIKWKYLTNNIRIGGKHQGKQWWHLLEVPTFVRAVSELLA
jgi:hypothetical protein